jgi:hypothetical protein
MSATTDLGRSGRFASGGRVGARVTNARCRRAALSAAGYGRGLTHRLLWRVRMTVAGTDQCPEVRDGVRLRLWADAAAAVGVVMAVLLLARGALAFTVPAALRLAGGEAGLPHHLLVWLRLALPAALVVTGLLGWWLAAAAVAWFAVAVEVVLDPSPVTISLTTVVALALSVPGSFRRGYTGLGPHGLWFAVGAAAIVGLGAPALTVAAGDVFTSGFVGFAIDSRIHSGIKVGQYAVVALALVLAGGSMAPPLRWRTLSVTAVVAAFIAPLVLADHAPFGVGALLPLDPVTALAVGAAAALVLAAFLPLLVERRLDQ